MDSLTEDHVSKKLLMASAPDPALEAIVKNDKWKKAPARIPLMSIKKHFPEIQNHLP
ncbi:hypothetical protein H1R20_g2451, partial [Candolleomyces eurysporus]